MFGTQHNRGTGAYSLKQQYWGYCGFPLWRRATGTGADLLWRVKVNLRLPVLERFGDGSYRSVLRGSGQDHVVGTAVGSTPTLLA